MIGYLPSPNAILVFYLILDRLPVDPPRVARAASPQCSGNNKARQVTSTHRALYLTD